MRTCATIVGALWPPIVQVSELSSVPVSCGNGTRNWSSPAAACTQAVHFSAHSGENLELLRAELCIGTSAFIGPSGVGKSSLLNAIQPDLSLKVRGVSESTPVVVRSGREMDITVLR